MKRDYKQEMTHKLEVVPSTLFDQFSMKRPKKNGIKV